MRIPANTCFVVLILACIISVAWAADEAAVPASATSTIVGSAPLPEEIEEAQRLATVAEDLRKQGKLADAEKAYKDALDRNASRTGPWGGLAQTYLDMGQYEKAAGTYERWLKVEPENALARAGLQKARTSPEASNVPAVRTEPMEPTKREKPVPSLPADVLFAADRLSYRILAQKKDFSPADVNAIMHDPSATPRNGEFIWLDANSPNFHEAIRNGRGAMLAFNKVPKVMLADGSWGITAAWPDKDQNGRPCLTVKFDKRGAKAFGKLTGDNIKQPLAIIIDDRIVSSPFIQSALSDTAPIIGDFTNEDVWQLLRALLPKTPLAVEAQLYRVATATTVPKALHDSAGMDSIAADMPYGGNLILSDEQARKFIESLTAQPETKQLAAQRVVTLSGETAKVSITAADPNLAAGNMKLSALSYLLKKNRIWVHLNCSASSPARQAQAAGVVPTNSMVIETKVRMEPGQQMLVSGPGSQFILIKFAPVEKAQPKSAR